MSALFAKREETWSAATVVPTLSIQSVGIQSVPLPRTPNSNRIHGTVKIADVVMHETASQMGLMAGVRCSVLRITVSLARFI